MNSLEVRYHRLSNASAVALIAIAVGTLAIAASATARHAGWIEGDSMWAGVLTLVSIAGYLIFGAIAFLGWRFARTLTPQQRAQVSGEFESFTATRTIRRAFIVAMIAAVLIGALPDRVDWPGNASAMTIFAIGMLSLAWGRLQSNR